MGAGPAREREREAPPSGADEQPVRSRDQSLPLLLLRRRRRRVDDEHTGPVRVIT